MARTLEAIAEELRSEALEYPETYEENPWGDRVVKVKGKMFFLCGVHKGQLNVTAKLPQSGAMAIQMPFAKPTGYGLGKSGWVTAHFDKATHVPVPVMIEWIEESFRAVAPKTVLKLWEARKGGSKQIVALQTIKPGTRVAVFGDDALRLKRATAALEERGFKVACTATVDPESLASLAGRKSQAIVIDLGRRTPAGLELAAALARSEFKGVPLFFAGARDAAGERKALASAPKAAGCLRVPPGDNAFVDLLVETLGKR